MDTKPDFLWLSLESVRADHTSLYGYERDTTPNLKRLSEREDATVLDPLISASMWTPASTASMLTGTHMSTHQVGQDGKAKEKLPEPIPTLPELLSDRGYETALFSTNHYISHDTGLSRGFDYTEFVNIEGSNFSGIGSVHRDSILAALRTLRRARPRSISALKSEIGCSHNHLLERRVNRWFKNQYQGNEPFFSYVHIPSPHHEYYPAPAFREEYLSSINMEASEATALSQQLYSQSDEMKRRIATGLSLSETEWEAIQALYDAEIRYADYTANQLISIAETASDRPLVVFVTGDHGDLFGECGLVGHNLVLHDGLINVPGLVIGIDTVVEQPETVTQQIDLTRTAAAIAGVDNQSFEGRDIRDSTRPYAISQRGVAHFDAYTKHNPEFDTSRFFADPFTSVRTAEWKLVENDNRQVFYELPDEMADVAEGHPDRVANLSALLDREDIEWSDIGSGETVEFDKDTREQLRDLGYLS